MFCKVCKDARKTEKEYTSHWVRDAPGVGGKVVCPTLLNQECKYCKEKGHTPKHCPKIQVKLQSQKEKKRVSFSSPPPPPDIKTRAPKIVKQDRNYSGRLAEPIIQVKSQKSWADMAASKPTMKRKEEEPPQVSRGKAPSPCSSPSPSPCPSPCPSPSPQPSYSTSTSWAD